MTLILIGVCEAFLCEQQKTVQLWWWKKQRLCRRCWRAQLGVRKREEEAA